MRSFCSGDTRARTRPSWSTSSPSDVLVVGQVLAHDHGALADRETDLPSDGQCRRRVVAGDHRDTDPGATARRRARLAVPGRGGSSRPISPRSSRSRSRPSAESGRSPATSGRDATPSTRSPRLGEVVERLGGARRPPSTPRRSRRARPSRAPRHRSTIDIRRRRGSNGKRGASGATRASTAVSMPSRRARASSAASIGSPLGGPASVAARRCVRWSSVTATRASSRSATVAPLGSQRTVPVGCVAGRRR